MEKSLKYTTSTIGLTLYLLLQIFYLPQSMIIIHHKQILQEF